MYWMYKMYVQKCANSSGDINMALLQIHTTLLGQGLPSLAMFIFNRQVHGIMSVIDHKPIGQDCDNDHHSKLLDRQHENNNDASPVFASIPIGSHVVVQWEDGGPWTHGTIVGTGDHNHHDRAYTIQLTTNSRQITHNRQHIKPTSITADTSLQYHTTKQSHTRTDPLADILNNINKNSMAHTSNNKDHSGQCHQQTNNNQKGEARDKEQNSAVANNDPRQENTNVSLDKRTTPQGSEVIKTRSGQIIKKPDRLVYTKWQLSACQHVSCGSISPMADYINSWKETLFVQHFAGQPTGQHRTFATLPSYKSTL